MQKKNKAFRTIHWGAQQAEEEFKTRNIIFDYGDMSQTTEYKDAPPAVMKDFIADFNWGDQLRFHSVKGSEVKKHEKFKYKFLTFIEQTFFGGEQIFGFKNYILLKR